jgi:hypothetical protein
MTDITQRAAELWSVAHGVAALAVGDNLQHVLPDAQISDLAESAARSWASGVPGALQDDAESRAIGKGCRT